ncbi:MAG: FAD-dependent oxidoreductase [Spiribacter sp.]|jgi:predicted NAD/FAD-dependent oxidoreductase|nr:FAD-dependent oxidoreductase [Spiribacter sp.]MDR9489317.1 FAD-dependent oxidoreductase [Spiribacter sp.]
MRIAIIGAGIAGLSAAQTLHRAGLEAIVYDKGRGPGGRMVSKRTEHGSIDLGAPYFTAREIDFRAEVSRWEAAGAVAPWSITPYILPERQPARAQTRLVASPKMSSLAKYLARDIHLQCEVQVSEISRELSGWVLRERHGETLGEFDALIVTAPAPQAQSLLAEPCPGLAAQAATARMQPCWSVGLVLAHPLTVDFDAGFPSSGPLGWVARSGSRPNRPQQPELWILHATAAWSEANIECSESAVAECLTDAFSELVRQPPEVADQIAHRWRFARARDALALGAGFIEQDSLLCAGDWLTDGRIEGAWQSGRAAAQHLLKSVV